MQLSPDAKERLGVVFDIVKTTFHWGFIPAVLYLGSANYFFDPIMFQNVSRILGFKKGAEPGMPELNVLR